MAFNLAVELECYKKYEQEVLNLPNRASNCVFLHNTRSLIPRSNLLVGIRHSSEDLRQVNSLLASPDWNKLTSLRFSHVIANATKLIIHFVEKTKLSYDSKYDFSQKFCELKPRTGLTKIHIRPYKSCLPWRCFSYINRDRIVPNFKTSPVEGNYHVFLYWLIMALNLQDAPKRKKIASCCWKSNIFTLSGGKSDFSL